MEIQIFQETNREGFIKIKDEITCKHCRRIIEEKTLEKFNYFEVRGETEESLRNKIETLCNKYFLEGVTYTVLMNMKKNKKENNAEIETEKGLEQLRNLIESLEVKKELN
ncbi:hypothetical protein C1646_759316 [Rhizophagus diaphanus]|nr:hypothetical protein C1646_759316 [Rhizophagus diaphanus] [Rhizophagus sp. MUCL 43196]